MSYQRTPEQKALRKVGLPESLMGDGFEAQLAGARALHAELLERIATLEASPEWAGKELPWKAEREGYKARVEAGCEPQFVTDVRLVQSVRPMWIDFMDDLGYKFRNGGLQAPRELRRAIAGKQPLKPGTKRARIVEAAGIDLEAARAAHRAENG